MSDRWPGGARPPRPAQATLVAPGGAISAALETCRSVPAMIRSGMPGSGNPLDGRAYWVEPGRLLAGAYPGAADPEVHPRKVTELHRLGIRHTVNLCEPGERLLEPYEPMWRGLGHTTTRVAIEDLTAPGVETVRAALDDIDGHLGRGEPVYVHCFGGHGRTGTIVGCWLVRHGIAAPREAIDLIATLRAGCTDAAWPSPETSEQRARILGWTPGR